jgi:hypothetical protein
VGAIESSRLIFQHAVCNDRLDIGHAAEIIKTSHFKLKNDKRFTSHKALLDLVERYAKMGVPPCVLKKLIDRGVFDIKKFE